MTATSFNPLSAARDLEAAGIERQQAEAIASKLLDAATADCPDAAAQELGSAKISIAHALRIAHGPARDYVPDHADDDERHHADIAAGRTCDWMREEERDLYDY